MNAFDLASLWKIVTEVVGAIALVIGTGGLIRGSLNKAKIDALHSTIAQLQANDEARKTAVELEKARSVELALRFTRLESQHTALLMENANLQQQNTLVLAQNLQLQTEVRQRDEQITGMQRQIHDLQRDLGLIGSFEPQVQERQ